MSKTAAKRFRSLAAAWTDVEGLGFRAMGLGFSVQGLGLN